MTLQNLLSHLRPVRTNHIDPECLEWGLSHRMLALQGGTSPDHQRLRQLLHMHFPHILTLGSRPPLLYSSNITEKKCALYAIFIFSLSGTASFSSHSWPQIYYIAEEGLELELLLPPLTEYWDYVCHHAHYVHTNPGLHACSARTLPSQLHPQSITVNHLGMTAV